MPLPEHPESLGIEGEIMRRSIHEGPAVSLSLVCVSDRPIVALAEEQACSHGQKATVAFRALVQLLNGRAEPALKALPQGGMWFH